MWWMYRLIVLFSALSLCNCLVVSLNDVSFEATGSGLWVVLYISPFCPACDESFAVLEKLSAMMEKTARMDPFVIPVMFAKIDVTESLEVFRSQEIQHVPSITMTDDGAILGYYHSHVRTVELLYQWIVQCVPQEKRSLLSALHFDPEESHAAPHDPFNPMKLIVEQIFVSFKDFWIGNPLLMFLLLFLSGLFFGSILGIFWAARNRG